MPDANPPAPTADKALLVSRNYYLGIAVTGPGLDLPARHHAAKAGFVPHAEPDAMVLPAGTDPDEAEKRAARVVALLYFAGYPVTLDASLVHVRPPTAVPPLGAATAALADATSALRVMPHPVDTAALLDAVRTGPLARTGELLDTAVPRADAVEDPHVARAAQQFLQDAAEHLASAEAALTNAVAVLRANPPTARPRSAPLRLLPPAQPTPTPPRSPRR